MISTGLVIFRGSVRAKSDIHCLRFLCFALARRFWGIFLALGHDWRFEADFGLAVFVAPSLL
jgi:hypothetical protein